MNERDGMIRFPLVLQGTPLGNVHFKVEQVGGTAVEGVDYSWRVQELELNNTLDTAYVELELLDNNTSDLIRTLVLEVTEVQGGYSLTSSSNILVNLRDDDVTLFFGATSYGVAETDKFLLIPLRLSQPLLEDVEIILDVFGESAVEGVDFTVEKTLSIPAGRDSTMVVVYVEDIEGYSADKQLSLMVKACEGGNVGYSDAVCNVAIWDCDTRLFFEEVPSVRSNASAFDVNVGLERALAHDVRFYVRSNSSIFIGAKEGYVIPAGQMSQVITVNMSREIDRDGDFEIFIENEYGAVSESRDVDVCVRWPIDKSIWSIDLNNSVTGGRATVLHLIDGNESTVWTNYSEFTGADNVPYEAVVSLGGVTDISYFELVRPSTDIMTLKVEVCITNAENWESGDWSEPIECEFSNAIYGGKVEYTWPTSQRATFVKVRVVDCMIDAGVGAKMGSLSELTLY